MVNAQTAAQQAFAESTSYCSQVNLGLGTGSTRIGYAEQMNLSNFQRAGLGADVGALGQLGSLRQGLQEQAQIKRSTTSTPDGSL